MPEYPITDRNRVRRQAKRASYDRALVHAIIDEALICHAAFVDDGVPVAVPVLHARMDESVVIHGSKAARLIRYVEAGGTVCLTFTLVDGLVLARSAFHHSINYRSAVVFGSGAAIEGVEQKMKALEAIVEHVTPGRWSDARPPNPQELDATAVVSVAIESASAKVRTGPPEDAPEDHALDVWAGVVPLRLERLEPIPDPLLSPGIDLPAYLRP
jgi:hypothetical protein